jgi:pSer/pThr/pTyr-binding forkhead associated (FHA) protein
MPSRLIALTEDSRRALKGDELVLKKFPFRVGRESRTLARTVADFVERRYGKVGTNNDLYIADIGEFFNISREHFMIEKVGEGFVITDAGSTCGTIVEGRQLGGNRSGGRVGLHDHDVIIVGTAVSPFVFKFRTD